MEDRAGLADRRARSHRRVVQGGRSSSASRPTLRWIWRCAGHDRWLVFLMLLVEVCQAVLGLVLAMELRQLIDDVVAGNHAGFVHATILLVWLLLALVGLGGVRRFLRDYTNTSVANRFRLREFEAVLARDYQRVSSVHSGEWMNRMNSDAAVVADGVTNIVPDVVSMLVRLVGAMALLLVMLPELAYVIIPGGCALALLTFLFRGKLKRLHKDQQEAQGRVRVFLLDRLQSLLVVHSFSQERRSAEGACERMADFRRVRMRRSNFSNICNIGFAAAMDGAYILGICYCAWRMLEGTMSYGTLIAVMALVSQVQSPFANISGYVPKYYAMLASAERLMEAESWADAFAVPPRPHDEVMRLYDERLAAIRFEDASFSYAATDARAENGDSACALDGPGELGDSAGKDSGKNPDGELGGDIDGTDSGNAAASGSPSRPVLRGLSMTIPKGSVVAITGPSGCGKSTMLKVLMGVYPLDGGQCVLDTLDGTMPLDVSWRGLFAYVPQGNQLMAGTIRQVVTFGDEGRVGDDEGIWRALAGACAEDFVRALPDGLDTQLGERGAGLSEGQVQRIAIARALYAGHPVLLLDESTSSLDEMTERELLLNLKRLAGRTVVLVTHRRAALDVCDYEVDMTGQGRLAEMRAGEHARSVRQ